MIDPLAEIISLLRPQAVFTKGISGAGRWAVRYADFGYPSFCAVVEGSCRLAVDGEEALTLAAGDFVLLPTTPGFTLSGFEPATPVLITPDLAPSPDTELRHGDPDAPANVRLLGGYFTFDVDAADLLVSMLPAQIRIRDVPRLSTLVRLLIEESGAQRPGRELVLGRLVEILLVEALCRVGIIPRMVMIAPSDMVVELGRILASGQFSADIRITFTNIAISTVLSVLLGFAAGVVIYSLPSLRDAIEPLLASYYAVPTFVFYPIFITLFGVGSASILSSAVLLALVSMVGATLNGRDRPPPVPRAPPLSPASP
eukprot:gene29513-38066_t